MTRGFQVVHAPVQRPVYGARFKDPKDAIAHADKHRWRPMDVVDLDDVGIGSAVVYQNRVSRRRYPTGSGKGYGPTGEGVEPNWTTRGQELDAAEAAWMAGQ